MKSLSLQNLHKWTTYEIKIPKTDLWLTGFYSMKSAGNTILDKEVRLVGLSQKQQQAQAVLKAKWIVGYKGDLGSGDNKARAVDVVIATVGKDQNNGPCYKKRQQKQVVMKR